MKSEAGMNLNAKALILAIIVLQKIKSSNTGKKSGVQNSASDKILKDQYRKIFEIINKIKKFNPQEINAVVVFDAGKKETGVTPLVMACMSGDNLVVQAILNNGADINHEYDGCPTPLNQAIHDVNIPLMKLLLENNADFRYQDPYDFTTILDFATKSNNADCVRLLLKSFKKNPKQDDKVQFAQAIFYAVENNLDVLDVYIEEKVDSWCFSQLHPLSLSHDKNSWVTPLCAAIYKKHLGMAKKLIALGVDLNHTSPGCQPPLHYALYSKALVELMLKNGARPGGEVMMVHDAIRFDEPEVIDYLLDRIKFNIDERIYDSTLLTLAAARGAVHSVISLINHGANIAGIKGKLSPLALAVEYQHLDVAKAILPKNAKILSKTDFEELLTVATRRSSLPVLQEIMRFYNICGHHLSEEDGLKLLQIAAREKHLATVCYLGVIIYPKYFKISNTTIKEPLCADIIMNCIGIDMGVDELASLIPYLYRAPNPAQQYIPDDFINHFAELIENPDTIILRLMNAYKIKPLFDFMFEMRKIFSHNKINKLSLKELMHCESWLNDLHERHSEYANNYIQSQYLTAIFGHMTVAPLPQYERYSPLIAEVFGTLLQAIIQEVLLGNKLHEVKQYAKVNDPADADVLLRVVKKIDWFNKVLFDLNQQLIVLPSAVKNNEKTESEYIVIDGRSLALKEKLIQVSNMPRDKNPIISLDTKKVQRENQKRSHIESDKIRTEEMARYKQELAEKKVALEMAKKEWEKQQELIKQASASKSSDRNKKKRLAKKAKKSQIQSEVAEVNTIEPILIENPIVLAERARLKKLEEQKKLEAEEKRKEREYQEEKRRRYLELEAERKRQRDEEKAGSSSVFLSDEDNNELLIAEPSEQEAAIEDDKPCVVSPDVYVNYPELCAERAAKIAHVYEVMQGFECDLVGGAVMKLLLRDDDIKDFDLITSFKNEDELNQLQALGFYHNQKIKIPGCLFYSFTGSLRMDLLIVQSKSETWRHDNALTRDLTISTLICTKKGTIIDPTGQGLVDLESRTLRIVGSADDYMADPVRLLRSIKLIAAPERFKPTEQLQKMIAAWETSNLSKKDSVSIRHFFIKYDEFVSANPNFLIEIQKQGLFEKLALVRTLLSSHLRPTSTSINSLFAPKQTLSLPVQSPQVAPNHMLQLMPK